jgi:two-component system heavy metal sensor histidine kinase CusS
MKGISITLRLTLLFASLSTAVLLSLGWLIGNAVENHFVEQDMELMDGKLHLVEHQLERIKTPVELKNLPASLLDSLVGHHDLSMMVISPKQVTLFASNNVNFPSSVLERSNVTPSPKPIVWQQSTTDGIKPLRGIAKLLPSGINGMPPLLVAVAVDITHHQHFMESFRKTLWLFVSLAVIIVSILGWAMVRHGLLPLKIIRQGAEAVTANKLDFRLQEDAVPVEMAELTHTLNSMLARLEDSFLRLKNFSSDLAHELRTPISNLMTQTQVALSQPRSKEEYQDILASNSEEFDRLAKMVADMLFLAQADNGLIVLNRKEINLSIEIKELFDFFDALSEDKNIKLISTGAAIISGDKPMLRRAFANLISNAIRHSPIGADIHVSIDQFQNTATLTILNQGDPILVEHLSHIFERFYRADPSRHCNGEGAGLGLAITKSIIQAHNGTIKATSNEDGVRFTVTFPYLV